MLVKVISNIGNWVKVTCSRNFEAKVILMYQGRSITNTKFSERLSNNLIMLISSLLYKIQR